MFARAAMINQLVNYEIYYFDSWLYLFESFQKNNSDSSFLNINIFGFVAPLWR